MQRPSPSESSLPQGPLILVNFLNYGHFPSYAANLTRWAISRGLEVVHLGLAQPNGPYARSFAGQDGLTLLHPAQLGLDAFTEEATATPDKALQTFGRQWRDLLAATFHRYPGAQAVLLNADHLFFETDECCALDLSLPGPTWVVATFAHREIYTGLDEPYTRRMNALLRHRQGFSGVFSIDEQHVLVRDPKERFLHLLPDPYREFHPPQELPSTHDEHADLNALNQFLDQNTRPVLPIIGKFDHRKNNLWILRAAEQDPGLRVVVLGQRVPDEETDLEIDAALQLLAGQGRLFARFGYVAQALFHAVLSSPHTPCLALPYRNHYGSSGIQLMAAEYGLPVLVPDTGLMAQRVLCHNLGRVFAVGDRDDFTQQLSRLAREGRPPYAAACAQFISNFGEEALGAALDRALLGRDRPASPLLTPGTDAGSRQEFLISGALAENRPDLALAQLHGGSGLSLRRAVLRWRTGAFAEASEELQRCLSSGLEEELAFLSVRVVDIARHDLAHGDAAQAVARTESWLACLFLSPEAAAQASGVALFRSVLQQQTASFLRASFWEWLGGMYIQAKQNSAAEACFRHVLSLDQDDLEIYLTLSDVLRYQGRNEASLAMLDALAGRAPEHPGLCHKRGQVLLQMGEIEGARVFFLREPRASRHWSAAQEHLARLGGAGASH